MGYAIVSYLLDTNAITAWVKKDKTFLARLAGVAPTDLCMSVVTEHELRYGIAWNPTLRLRGVVERLLEVVPLIAMESPVAARAAQLKADLRRHGVTVGPYDLLIAATALVHNLTMVTHNTREFNRIPGLQVEDWQ